MYYFRMVSQIYGGTDIHRGRLVVEADTEELANQKM